MNGYGHKEINTVNFGVSTPVSMKPESPIDSGTNRLAMATQSLSEVVGHLCDRLTPVLLPAGLNAVPGGAVSVKPETPLSEAINRQADKVYELSGQLADLLTRLGLA